MRPDVVGPELRPLRAGLLPSADLPREPDLIEANVIAFLANALVLPTADPENQKRFDAEAEAIAVKAAWAFEEVAGRLSRRCPSRAWRGRLAWKTIRGSTCSRTEPEKGAGASK
jgi:hypothetical protein